MSIRYDQGYNAKIARTVKNFNRKRNRAFAKGYRDLPQPVKVSDLKARFQTRKDLNKELALMSKFSKGGEAVLKTIENLGGASSTAWNLEYLKQNVKQAREYFISQYKQVAAKVGEMPGERLRLELLADKISFLDMDVKYMNQQQFKSYQATINEYLRSPGLQRGGYRGFLSEVTGVMRMVGVKEKDINQFVDKMKQLTPEQFTKMYEESALVSRIYDLADSPIYGSGIKLNTSEEKAKELVDTLLEETDDLVKKAKANKEPEYDWNALDDFIREVERTPHMKPERTKDNKIKRSSLTPKEVRDLKALGWDDLIDENQ